MLCNLIVLKNCVKKLNCVIENLVERKEGTNCLTYFTTRDARRFVYPQIMDGSGHMGGANSTCGNGDYEREAKSSWVYNSTREAAS